MTYINTFVPWKFVNLRLASLHEKMKYIGDIKSVYMMSSEIGKVAYRLRHSIQIGGVLVQTH